jgi:hypothetical protein
MIFLIRSSQTHVLVTYIFYAVKILLYELSFLKKISKNWFEFCITQALYLTETDQNIAIYFDLSYSSTKFHRNFNHIIIIIIIIIQLFYIAYIMRIYSLEWVDDRRMMKWEGFGRKRE